MENFFTLPRDIESLNIGCILGQGYLQMKIQFEGKPRFGMPKYTPPPKSVFFVWTRDTFATVRQLLS